MFEMVSTVHDTLKILLYVISCTKSADADKYYPVARQDNLEDNTRSTLFNFNSKTS